MAAGRPVAATDVGDIAATLPPEARVGVVLGPAVEDHLGGALAALASDPRARPRSAQQDERAPAPGLLPGRDGRAVPRRLRERDGALSDRAPIPSWTSPAPGRRSSRAPRIARRRLKTSRLRSLCPPPRSRSSPRVRHDRAPAARSASIFEGAGAVGGAPPRSAPLGAPHRRRGARVEGGGREPGRVRDDLWGTASHGGAPARPGLGFVAARP